MAQGQENGLTNGVHESANGFTKAKVLPKSFDSIESTIAAFGASSLSPSPSPKSPS